MVVLDALRERKPAFSPEEVVSEFAELLKSYRITKITGDRYAGDWPRERFREHGVGYEPAQNRNPICTGTCCLRSTAASSTSSTMRAS